LQAAKCQKWQKVPENRDQGIGLNGTVKTKSLTFALGGAAFGVGPARALDGCDQNERPLLALALRF